MDFDALLPAARRDALAVADLEIGRDRHQPQRVGRGDQPPIVLQYSQSLAATFIVSPK